MDCKKISYLTNEKENVRRTENNRTPKQITVFSLEGRGI